MLVPKIRSKDLQFRSKEWGQKSDLLGGISSNTTSASVSMEAGDLVSGCSSVVSVGEVATDAPVLQKEAIFLGAGRFRLLPTRGRSDPCAGLSTASTTSSSSTTPSPAPLLCLKAPQYTHHHHRYPRCHRCRFLIPLLFHAPACKVPLDWEGVVVDVVVRRPLRSWWWMCIWWRASAAAAATGLPRAPGADGPGAARGGGEP
jgi:hypothetical protein